MNDSVWMEGTLVGICSFICIWYDCEKYVEDFCKDDLLFHLVRSL